MIQDIKIPDSVIAHKAEELARSVSSEVIYNHVMRSYWFGQLFAMREGTKVDDELMFLSCVLHDLGLTNFALNSHRFEVEGAVAARSFLLTLGVAEARAQLVWDNIALHTWDLNQFRGDTSRLMQMGIAFDVTGGTAKHLDPETVAEVVRLYPRLNFKNAFNAALHYELESKSPYPHCFHICSRAEHNRSPLVMADSSELLNRAPFSE